MKTLLYFLLFVVCCAGLSNAVTVYIGDDAAAGQGVADNGGTTDGSDGNFTYAFTTVPYTNNSGEVEQWRLIEVNFFQTLNCFTPAACLNPPGTLTPFVALYDGDPPPGSQDFRNPSNYTVISVGDGIIATTNGAANNARFLVNGTNPVITLNAGEVLIAGFNQSIGIVPFSGVAAFGDEYIQAGNTIPAGPLPAILTGSDGFGVINIRDYPFNVGMEPEAEGLTGVLVIIR